MNSFSGVRVFSTTVAVERVHLGELVTAWISAHVHLEIVDIVISQSSDAWQHCMSICIFYKQRTNHAYLVVPQ